MVLNSADFLDDADLEAFILSTAADAQRTQDSEISVSWGTAEPEGGVECQLCNAPLGDLNTEARQAHYEQHFEDGGVDDELESLYDHDQELLQPVAGPSGSNSISHEDSGIASASPCAPTCETPLSFPAHISHSFPSLSLIALTPFTYKRLADSDDTMGNSSFLESVRRMSRSSFGLGSSETVDPAQNVFWHAGLDTQQPHNFTAGAHALLGVS